MSTYKPKVYLAGGFKSGWQKIIMDQLDQSFHFFDPSEHHHPECDKFTTWDLHHVRVCDILFGYMEKSNPSGYGLTLEIGYANALQKSIILVDERSPSDPDFFRYFEIARESSSVVFDCIDDGIEYLHSFNPVAIESKPTNGFGHSNSSKITHSIRPYTFLRKKSRE